MELELNGRFHIDLHTEMGVVVNPEFSAVPVFSIVDLRGRPNGVLKG